MRKIYSLFLLIFAAVSVNAQVIFCDKDGNEIKDGTNLVRTEVSYQIPELQMMPIINSELFVRNVNEETTTSYIVVEKNTFDNGSLQLCYPEQCQMLTAFPFKTTTKTISTTTPFDLQTELSNFEGLKTATCDVTYQIMIVKGESDVAGPKVNVVYLYGDAAASINNPSVSTENPSAFNLSGQRVSNDYKGVVVRNGKKFLNK